MTEPVQPRRINVAVTPETVELLASIIERDQISLTEAVRQMIGVGAEITRLIKEEGATVTASTPEWTREVVLFS
jgi:hypothetical protein